MWGKKGIFSSCNLVNIYFYLCSNNSQLFVSKLGWIAVFFFQKKNQYLNFAEDPCPMWPKQKWIHPNSAAVSFCQLSSAHSFIHSPVRPQHWHVDRAEKEIQLTVRLSCNCWPVDVYREAAPLYEHRGHWQDTFVYHTIAQCPVLSESLSYSALMFWLDGTVWGFYSSADPILI